jgi:hypothetical protein
MVLKIENMGPRSQVHIVWGAIAVIILVSARIFAEFLRLTPPCIFRTLTGIPCLTCGGTHCVAALSQLHPLDSFLYNPLIMVGLIAMIPYSLGYAVAIIFRRRVAIALSKSEKRALRISVILLLVANWAYLIISMT